MVEPDHKKIEELQRALEAERIKNRTLENKLKQTYRENEIYVTLTQKQQLSSRKKEHKRHINKKLKEIEKVSCI